MTHVAAHGPMTTRRQFLIAGGTAVAAAALLGGDVMPFPSGLELLADAPGPRIPIAFIPGSAGAASLAAALAEGGARAVSAFGARLETRADGPVTMSVHGFAGDASAVSRRYAHVFTDALIPSPAVHDETTPYYAWTYRGAPVASESSRTRMLLAESTGARLGLSVSTSPIAGAAESSTGGSSSEAASTAVLTTRPRPDLATFQPGVYLLGLIDGMWSNPTSLPALDDPAWTELPSLVMVLRSAAD